MTAEVLTIISHWPEKDYYCHREWAESVKRSGSVPRIIVAKNWQGLLTKPRELQTWLKSNDSLPECIIFTDSWDQILSKSVEHIVDLWQKDGCVWTCGGERNCFPDASLADKHPKCATSYRFLNSGFIISTPADMLKVLDHMNLDSLPDDHQLPDGTAYHSNDQDTFMRAFLDQPVPMRIDSETRYVWNLCGVEESNFDFSTPIPTCRGTGNAPCAFHFNGDAKTSGMQDKILKHLQLR